MRKEPSLRRPGLGMAGQLPVPCTESEWLVLKWRSQTLREGLLDQKLGLLAKWMLKTPRMERERERESTRKLGADGNREVGGWGGIQVSFRKCGVWKGSGMWATTSSPQKGLHRSVLSEPSPFTAQAGEIIL